MGSVTFRHGETLASALDSADVPADASIDEALDHVFASHPHLRWTWSTYSTDERPLIHVSRVDVSDAPRRTMDDVDVSYRPSRPVGRPLEGDEPRDERITLRMTKSEREAAQAAADAAGMTLGRWIAWRASEGC